MTAQRPQIPHRDFSEWEEWAEAHPLHKAVVGERPGRQVIELRVQQAIEWVGTARTRPTQLRLMAEHWGVSTRTFDAMHAEAIRRIKAKFEQDRPDFLSQKLEQLEALVQAGLDSGQLSAAAGAMGLLLRATGCDQPQQRQR